MYFSNTREKGSTCGESGGSVEHGAKGDVGVGEGDTAKAQAEIKGQTARVEQLRRQLEADVVLPATAEQLRATAEARGVAAKTVEEGKATAEALRKVNDAWKQAGDHARDIFLMQKLDSIMKTVASTIEGIDIDKITVVDGGAGGAGWDANRLVAANEQVKATLGLDIPGIVNRLTTEEPETH